MKKQIKKLSLNKKTISNLIAAEMNKLIGGGGTKGHKNTCYTCAFSCAYTCHDRTCYPCGF